MFLFFYSFSVRLFLFDKREVRTKRDGKALFDLKTELSRRSNI